MHADLVDGHDEGVGVNRVARLMARAGIQGVSGRRRGPRTTTPARGRRKPPDRVCRDFSAPAPNRLWLADISYLATDEGWLYLAVILDVFSRRIVCWATADHLGTDLPLAALDMALRDRLVRPDLTVGVLDAADRERRLCSGNPRRRRPSLRNDSV